MGAAVAAGVGVAGSSLRDAAAMWGGRYACCPKACPPALFRHTHLRYW